MGGGVQSGASVGGGRRAGRLGPVETLLGLGCSSSLSGLEQGRGWCFQAFWLRREGWGHTCADAETVEEEVEASRRFKR